MTLVEMIKDMTITELFELGDKMLEELKKETDMDEQLKVMREIDIVSKETSRRLGII